jgi:hypothetical protein
MKVLFFTLVPIYRLKEKGIYADLISEFSDQGDYLDYYFPSTEKYFYSEKNITFNSIQTSANPQKQTNFLKKFLLYLKIEKNLSKLIKKTRINYDLLLLVTPSIFQLRVINSFKKRNPNSKVFLLLKDIFPDNAIDLGILENKFPINFAISFFKLIEKKLYNKVDQIGCMTPLNIEYIKTRHKSLTHKLFLSPNSIKTYEIPIIETRKTLDLPFDKIILIYTGNIGLPQDPIFINEFIYNLPDIFFLILIGTGANFNFDSNGKLKIINKFMKQEDIDQYLINSDYGLVFLSSKFNVPNYPSKILSYMNAKLPTITFSNSYNDLNPSSLTPISQFNSYSWYLSNSESLLKFFESNISHKKFINYEIPSYFNISLQVSIIKDRFNNETN